MTPKRIINIILLISILVLILVLFSKVHITFANPVEVKVSWDADNENDNCNDVCVSYGAPRADGYALPADASTYLVFTDKEFVEKDCSFALVNTFKRSTLAVGQPVYTDRDYTITEIPPEFDGYNAIILPNDQRAATDATDYLEFAVPSYSTVYVAFDSRFTELPNWLRKFTKLNKAIKTSLHDTRSAQLDIYALKYKDCFIAWQNIKFYVRDEGAEHDFANPIHTLSQSYVDGLSTPTDTIVTVECENFVVTNKYFVLRSGAMVGTEEIQSEDSDEVQFICDMTRPEKTLLSVNQTPTDYVFVWTDTGERTWRYQLQYSYRDPATNRGGYKVLRTIDAPALTVSVPIDEIQNLLVDNETMWLTMVSITKAMIYSRWTDEDVRIDRYVPVTIQPVRNIKIITE